MARDAEALLKTVEGEHLTRDMIDDEVFQYVSEALKKVYEMDFLLKTNGGENIVDARSSFEEVMYDNLCDGKLGDANYFFRTCALSARHWDGETYE